MTTSVITNALAEHYGVTPDLEDLGDNVWRAGPFAVKQFADSARAQREAGLLATLAGGGSIYRVQQLVRTLQGDLFAEAPGSTLVLTRWCDGVKKLYTEITEPEWRSLGAALATMHYRLDNAFVNQLPRASEYRIDIAAEYAALLDHPARTDPAIARYLDVRLQLLDAFGARGLAAPPVPERPIHNDYNQHNYLFDGTLPPIVLDWEGAIAAPREYEVVRCMNHLPLVAPGHASAFVEGYRSVRHLDRAGLRWAVDRAFVDHAVKSWPLERARAGLPGGAAALAGSIEVVLALRAGVVQLERFYGVEGA